MRELRTFSIAGRKLVSWFRAWGGSCSCFLTLVDFQPGSIAASIVINRWATSDNTCVAVKAISSCFSTRARSWLEVFPKRGCGREVTYNDVPPEEWERELKKQGLPDHVTRHLVTMAELHRAGRYDRLAVGVERMTGRRAMSVRKSVSLHADEFGGRRS